MEKRARSPTVAGLCAIAAAAADCGTGYGVLGTTPGMS